MTTKHKCGWCGKPLTPNNRQLASLRRGCLIYCNESCSRARRNFISNHKRLKIPYHIKIDNSEYSLHCKKYDECYSMAARKNKLLHCDKCESPEIERDCWRKQHSTKPSTYEPFEDDLSISLKP